VLAQDSETFWTCGGSALVTRASWTSRAAWIEMSIWLPDWWHETTPPPSLAGPWVMSWPLRMILYCPAPALVDPVRADELAVDGFEDEFVQNALPDNR